ncbi:MAG: hypothetical protein ACYDBJ_28765 [Aggregatilineales bacterium]
MLKYSSRMYSSPDKQSEKRSTTRSRAPQPPSVEPTTELALALQRLNTASESLSAADVLQLQRTVGNRAVTQALRRKRADSRGEKAMNRSVVQRLNGAVPQNFTAAAAGANNAQLELRTNKTWTSSTGSLADLSDVQMREHIVFNHNPATDIPSYPVAVPMIPGMTLAGNTLTKVAGHMAGGGGTDTHSGAGFGPEFTVAGQPNLAKNAWNLVGTQEYQYRDTAGLWQPLHPGSTFTITRDMALNPATHGYEMTFTKPGPFGINMQAGPTPITMSTTEAMGDVLATRPDQAAIWTAIDNEVTTAKEHHYTQIRTANKTITGVTPNLIVPVNFIITEPNLVQADVNNQAFAAFQGIPQAEYTPVFANAESAINKVVQQYMRHMTAAPSRIDIILTKLGGNVRQQGIYTAAGGGVFRIVLRYDKFTTISPADKDTTMAGTESKKGWSKAGKRERWQKATITHEMGHLLHAFGGNNDKFQSATIDMMTANALAPHNPAIEAQLYHIAGINDQIMNALRAKNYAQKWTYAKDNPAEVVAEVWTALINGRTVPRGLAAVYLAYGGMRNATIDNTLRRRFPHNQIPAMNQPEDAIPHI